MNTNYHIASSPRIVAFSNVNSGSVISVRTSDKTYRSVGSGSATSGGHAVTSFDAYAVKKTASFTAIHNDVSGLQSSLMPQPKLYTEGNGTDGSSGERPGIGDTNGNPAGGQEYPMGDMLLPLLVMTMAYVVIKIFRNRKISKAL